MERLRVLKFNKNAHGTVACDNTEGDDKPKKYPRMFLTSELMLISKADLLPYVPFSIEAATKDALEVNPKIEVLTISSTSSKRIDKWFEWLMERVEEKKQELVAM